MRHTALAALAALALAAPALAQSSGAYTLAQVEKKYPRMAEVHILKCDRNGDGMFTRSEMTCVSSIYQAMYIDD